MIKETRARRLRVGLVLVHHHPGALGMVTVSGRHTSEP